ncbi:MAG: hypoxanthine-guanine phosphoribosyltransferase [Candidatus Tyloplasma litorale]|nr:MAG: hypoxanthine-guanine phosphoribosyltransferase [Mycoplasmatales bacterium]
MGTENKHIIKILKTHSELVKEIKILAKKLNKKFVEKDKEVVLISIIKGGLPFTLELMKHLDFDVSMDFISSSSYYLDKQISEARVKYDATIPIKGKDIIITDDLVDSGKTLNKVCEILEAYEPKSITVSAIYGKPKRLKTKYDELFCWEEEPGGFLLGFGLDYDEKYRNLPYIAIIKEDE